MANGAAFFHHRITRLAFVGGVYGQDQVCLAVIWTIETEESTGATVAVRKTEWEDDEKKKEEMKSEEKKRRGRKEKEVQVEDIKQ